MSPDVIPCVSNRQFRDLVSGKITWVGVVRPVRYRFRRSCLARSFCFMPYLKLRNARSGEVFEFERDEVRIGRAPDLELPLEGEGSEVVSGNHARAVFRGGALPCLGTRTGSHKARLVSQCIPGLRGANETWKRYVKFVRRGLGSGPSE